MDYEKEYKELVGKIDKAYLYAQTDSTKAVLEEIRPELKESEDERMLREIKRYIKEQGGKPTGLPNGSVAVNDMLAWLEKQNHNTNKEYWRGYREGKQEILDKYIELEKQGDTFTKKDVDNAYLKGVCDAKQELEKQGEQKKDIHNKLTDFKCSLKHIMEEAIECGDTHNLNADADMLLRLVQNPAWSEEDEVGLGDAMWAITQAKIIAKDENDMGNLWYAEKWLKSLKDRVQPQPKQEWSKEDDEMMQYVIGSIDTNISDLSFYNIRNWFKSLKERYTWKPSELQIEALESATENCAYSEYQDCLQELIEQLKNLKG